MLLPVIVGARALDGFVAGEVEGVGRDASLEHGLYPAPETFDSRITVVVDVVRLDDVADVDFGG